MKNSEIKKLAEKQFLFNEIFMERFFTYAGHKRGCTWDDSAKGDICTCGFQALIDMWYEIKDGLGK